MNWCTAQLLKCYEAPAVIVAISVTLEFNLSSVESMHPIKLPAPLITLDAINNRLTAIAGQNTVCLYE